MARPISGTCLLTSLAAAVPALVSAQAAQARAPTFRISDSVQVELREEVRREPRMALLPDGSIAAIGRGMQLTLHDSSGRQRWIRDLRRDLRMVNALGWRGDSLFLADNVSKQILSVGANGGVGNSIDHPDLVRPLWKDRHTMAVYGTFDATVLLPDGHLIGAPRNPRSTGIYGSRNSGDPTRIPIVRIDQDGVVQRRLATIVNGPRGDAWWVLNDGRLVILRPQGDSLGFWGISPAGDTLFSRMLAKQRAVVNAIGGPDGTIWVTTGAGTPKLTHTAFDARGNTIGSIELPVNLRIGAGDATHVWVFSTQGNSRRITRFTLRR